MRKKLNSCIIRIIALYLGIPALIALCLYPFLPVILQYPPNSIDNQFQVAFDGITYTQQYILLIGLIVACSLIVLFIRAYRIHSYLSKLDDKNVNLSREGTVSILYKVRALCYSTPYLLYFLEILLPFIFLPVTFILIDAYPITILKICLVYLSFFTLASVTSFVFSKNEFGSILTLLNNLYPDIMEKIELEYSNKKRSKIKSLSVKLILQFLPLVVVSLVFISLVGYEQASQKTGNIYYDSYSTMIGDSFNKTFSSKEEVIKILDSVTLLDDSHQHFIINSDGTSAISNGNQLEPFFIKYVLENSEEQSGRTYDYFCLDSEGLALKCNLENGDYCYAGIRYSTSQPQFLKFILICDLLLFVLILAILVYVSRSLAKEINTVSTKLKEIASSNERDINLNKKLIVTSEDELADLSLAFNQTQKFTRNNIKQIRANQSMLMERERLASLGQLIGGIAHNLKTPIMSIAGAAEALDDLAKEYDSSIDDPEVNSNDHHEIAKDMETWVAKIRNYTEYMSDIITAVKGQAVTLSEAENVSFDIEELIKRVDILMKHELKNAIIYLNVSVKVPEKLKLQGDINSLVQVINNMISNSIQSYNGKPEQTIDLIVEQKDANLIISVRDYGCGLPEKVKDKLFNEMITTKGKNGTGLGLYMSYSTIKAHFNGNITFESEVGKGTTFHIIIPLE